MSKVYPINYPSSYKLIHSSNGCFDGNDITGKSGSKNYIK